MLQSFHSSLTPPEREEKKAKKKKVFGSNMLGWTTNCKACKEKSSLKK